MHDAANEAIGLVLIDCRMRVLDALEQDNDLDPHERFTSCVEWS